MRAPSARVAALIRRAQWRVAAFALASICLLMAAGGVYMLREYERRSMDLVARSLAFAGEPALLFRDKQAMLDLIEAVAEPGQLADVVIFDALGANWLRYERPMQSTSDTWARRLERLLVPAPAIALFGDASSPLGSIQVHSDGKALMRFLMWTLLSIVTCLLATAALVAGYSRRLSASIVEPIGALAALTRQVRESRSFERRAGPSAVQELDALADDFNALLSEMQRQQVLIDDHHTGLLRANESLRNLSRHDALTNLPNRAYLNEHLGDVIEKSRHSGLRAGIVFVDTDRFKEVNDRFGHAAGDALLVELSCRLRASIRNSDFVARLGGDEFVIVITPLRDPREVTLLTDRVRAALDTAVSVPGGQLQSISVTMGIALFPDHAETADGLIRAADEAMYQAKSAARGSVATFRSIDKLLPADADFPARPPT